MKTKFSKLFVTILIVAAVTCCGALGVFAADDANADTTAATTASETVNTDNDHNSSLSIALVAAASVFIAIGEIGRSTQSGDRANAQCRVEVHGFSPSQDSPAEGQA